MISIITILHCQSHRRFEDSRGRNDRGVDHRASLVASRKHPRRRKLKFERFADFLHNETHVGLPLPGSHPSLVFSRAGVPGLTGLKRGLTGLTGVKRGLIGLTGLTGLKRGLTGLTGLSQVS